VQLTISARDDSPGAIQMRLREGTGTWSSWSALETSTWYRVSPGDGLKTVSVEFLDIYGNQSRTYSASITLDTRAPRITNVRSSVTASSATITWNTDEPAGSRVEFGTSSSRMAESAGASGFTGADASTPSGDVGTRAVIVTPVPSSSLRTTHSVTVTGLRASTTYYYQVVSVDAAGNVAALSGLTFTTSGGIPPVTPPVIPPVTPPVIPPVTPPVIPPVTPPANTKNVNFAAASNGGKVTVSKFSPAKSGSAARPGSAAIDGDAKTYWEADLDQVAQWMTIEFSGPKVIDYVRTTSQMGYYPTSFVVEAEIDGKWISVGGFASITEESKVQKRTGTTVMHEFSFEPIAVTKIRLTVRRVSNPTNPVRLYEVEAMYTGK